MKRLQLSDSKFEEREGYERSVLFTPDDFKADTKLQLAKLAPGATIKPHRHNVRTECFLIISGEGQIKINGEVAASSKDEIILCEPGDMHEFVNTSRSEPFIVLVIRTNDPGNIDLIWED